MTNEEKKRYAAARRAVIARRYSRMNPRQLEAVLATEGPLLLLAGAGSGKTTVLIDRVDNLLTFGRGSDTDEVPGWATAEDLAFLENFPQEPSPGDWERAIRLCAVEPAPPWSVIAITFTNKAAGELRERLETKCGPAAAKDLWASTFHRACVRILRRDVEKLGIGLDSHFTIYDGVDSKRVVHDVTKLLGLSDREFPARDVLSIISRAKERDQGPEDFAREAAVSGDWRMPRVAQIYEGFQRQLLEADAVDFDDIIRWTVHLLRRDEEVRTYYQHKFRYVLVDEYQDTNHLQYQLTRLLAGGRRQLCVVGDDDQSIYRFRGADLQNILSFEEEYPDCRTIRLEQNYRSTQNILDAANAVIRNNTGRKGKELWTDSGPGDKILVRTATSESDEADFVAGRILDLYSKGGHWKDCAVLYRMNAQSNALEMAMRRNAIPYKVYGGMKFFDRSEVRDMLAYLLVIHNQADDLHLRRIVNVPTRGIGATTMGRCVQMAEQEGCSLFDVMENATSRPELASAALRLRAFTDMMRTLRGLSETMSLPDFYDAVCDRTGYLRALEEKGDSESRSRIDNVRELRSSIAGFLESGPEDPTLAGFLDSVSLFTDLDETPEDGDCVTLMTIHSAKGLEFPNVFVVGMEEGIFPAIHSIGEEAALEEERRLCYVAMTRAKERLTMTAARQRMLYGSTSTNLPSRFLDELPEGPVVREGPTEPPTVSASGWSREPGWEDAAFGRTDSLLVGSRRITAKTVAQGQAPSPSPAPVRPRKNWDSGYTAATTPGREPLMDLKSGDAVRHRTFGEGIVMSVKPMGNDALVEVVFAGLGAKRLMLRSASQHLTRL